MYCPRCRIEYEQGIAECKECGSPLVEELPPEPEGEYVDWVTVMTTVDKNAVMVAQSMLEDAGISVLVKGEALTHVFPTFMPLEVQVMPENEAEARLILERQEGPPPEE